MAHKINGLALFLPFLAHLIDSKVLSPIGFASALFVQVRDQGPGTRVSQRRTELELGAFLRMPGPESRLFDFSSFEFPVSMARFVPRFVFRAASAINHLPGLFKVCFQGHVFDSNRLVRFV